jgi:glycosyl hydrolase family 12/concanavalin A-like lectin/glucanase superfamily protein
MVTLNTPTGTAALTGGYTLQVNEWNSTAAETITSDGNPDFEITVSAISVSHSGAPGGYASIYYGNHYGTLSAPGTTTNLPIQVSSIISGGVALTSAGISISGVVGGSAYDAAYDIWFVPTATGNQGGTDYEMMVWLQDVGGVQPAGSVVASGVVIAGQTWNVWSNGSTTSYVLVTPATSITNLDIGLLAADSVSRGYITSSWWLIDVEFGFEVWTNGAGLQCTSYSVSIAGTSGGGGALPLTQDFEEGTNGTAVTAGNSGGGSPYSSAFDSVTTTNGAACVFSSAQAAHGSLSGAFTTAATAGTSYVTWAASVGGAQPVIYGRVYVYLTADPVADTNIVSFYNGGTFGGGIMIADSGQLRLQNASFGEVGGGPTLPLGQWFRLEFGITAGAAGVASATVNYYSSPDSATPAGAVTDTAGAYGSGGGINTVNFGWTASNASQPALYLDCLQVNITGFPGPEIGGGGSAIPGVPAVAAAAAPAGSLGAAGTSPVQVVGQWNATWAPGSGFQAPDPSIGTVRASIANTGTAGNWVIAVWAIRQIAGQPAVTAAIGDDAHNYWEPLGAPNGTTPPGAPVRCGIWAARSPRQAATVFMSRGGGTAAAACLLVFEVSGLSPWETLTGIVAGELGGVNTISLSLPAAGASALVVSACTADVFTAPLSIGGSGWSALTPASVDDAFDNLSDLTLAVSWKVTPAPVAAPWSIAGPPADLAALAAVILVVGVPPAPAAPDWPMIQFQAAFGGGALTPWDELTWTDLSARYQGMTTQRGKQYELDTVQAGTVTFTLSNNDAHLTPGYAGSPYPVQVYTPVRVLVTWPPPPSPAAITYIPFRGFMERWPQALTSSRYQISGAVATDAWALLTSLAQTVARAEILADNPWAYWPCGDPAGNATVQNLAPGSTAALQVTVAKDGPAGAVPVFGASTTLTVLAAVSSTLQSTLAGDPGSTCWSQAGLGAGDTSAGYTLQYSDTALSAPTLTNGVTFEGWFAVADTVQPAGGNLCLLSVGGPQGQVYQLYLDVNGYLNVNQWNSSTRTVLSSIIESSRNWANGAWFHLAVTVTQTFQQPYINGVTLGNAPSTTLDATWYTVSFNGQSNRWASGGMFNGTVYGAAVFGGILTPARIATHYWSALAALAGTDTADQRMERLLMESQSGFPRCLAASPNIIQGAVDQQGQQLATNLINIAESDSGLLYVDGPGYICYQSRAAGYNLPAAATLGENTTGGETPYLPDIAFDYDPSQVYNDIQLTQLSAPQAVDGAAVSVVITPSDAAAVTTSIEQYGDQTLQETTYLFDPGATADLANWIFWTSSGPQIRVSTLTLDPGANPALWPVALGLEVGQVYQVNRRLMGTQVIISGLFQLMSVAHASAARSWTVKLTLVTYPGEVLTADDPVRGQLDGQNAIGWLPLASGGG